ncbi:MAG TPA: hypothetical protein DIC59_14830 [Candidatus Competibacteraceae bacterium]|nr:hypothetical protein [Candidatus Competibacteraceae bacterium]
MKARSLEDAYRTGIAPSPSFSCMASAIGGETGPQDRVYPDFGIAGGPADEVGLARGHRPWSTPSCRQSCAATWTRSPVNWARLGQRADARIEEVPGTAETAPRSGDAFATETPGGGGYGEPGQQLPRSLPAPSDKP